MTAPPTSPTPLTGGESLDSVSPHPAAEFMQRIQILFFIFLCLLGRYRITGDAAGQEPRASIVAIATVEVERGH